jgi:hypothetical protein
MAVKCFRTLGPGCRTSQPYTPLKYTLILIIIQHLTKFFKQNIVWASSKVVQQSTRDPTYEGSNPAAIGSIKK